MPASQVDVPQLQSRRPRVVGQANAGSQYTSITFTDHLADERIRTSIGTAADAYDCAPMG